MKKLTLALISFISLNSIEATSLVRRAARGLVSNRVTKTIVKPVSWITQTQFYKKHPWLVKGAGACLAAIATKKAIQTYRHRQQLKQEAQQPRSLIRATRQLDLAKVKALISAGADLNTRDNDGFTALHLASSNGGLEIVRALINAKAQLNIQSNEGSTALHVAVIFKQLAIVQELINAGADLKIENTSGNTAFDFSVTSGNSEITQTFLDAGIHLNTNFSHDPLFLAAAVSDLKTAQALIDAHANIHTHIIAQLPTVGQFPNNDAMLKIIEARRQKIFAEIDGTLHLNPKEINALITDYLVPPLPKNTPAQDADSEPAATQA